MTMAWTAEQITEVEELLDATLLLLESRPRELTYERVSRVTGLSVSWLNKVAGEKIKEPSVLKITLLWAFLTRYKQSAD